MGHHLSRLLRPILKKKDLTISKQFQMLLYISIIFSYAIVRRVQSWKHMIRNDSNWTSTKMTLPSGNWSFACMKIMLIYQPFVSNILIWDLHLLLSYSLFTPMMKEIYLIPLLLNKCNKRIQTLHVQEKFWFYNLL